MPELCTIYDYMRAHATLLGERILQEYPALHQFDDPVPDHHLGATIRAGLKHGCARLDHADLTGLLYAQGYRKDEIVA